ncbi:MAG: hypothetical protein KKH74_15090 [Gammaproteobacteria bacterium]|nr:hypothetical protein [Gammaproteobacteria bacterium]
MSIIDVPELDGFFESMSSEIQQFRREQEGTWALVGAAYLTASIVFKSAQTSQHLQTSQSHRVMMWATALDYLMDSFFLILRRRLDAGLALLRLASELARDIARVAENEKNLKVWLNRSDKAALTAYRKEFKFNDADRIESYVHQLYDLASKIGVHGHMSTTMALRPAGASPDGSFLIMEVPVIEVYKALEIWLAGFYPIQSMCLKSFADLNDDRFREARLIFAEGWKVFDSAFAVFRRELAEMSADVLSSLH